MARIINARDTRFGGYLEDYEVGDRYIHWPGKTITQAEDHMFCMITMAASPIHVDSNYASTEMSGGRNLVVGSFIYSLLLGMSVSDISGRAIANLGVEKLRHTAPMYHGDTLYGETTIVHARSSKSRPATGIMTVETTGYNQDKKVVCTFMRSVLLPKRAEG